MKILNDLKVNMRGNEYLRKCVKDKPIYIQIFGHGTKEYIYLNIYMLMIACSGMALVLA